MYNFSDWISSTFPFFCISILLNFYYIELLIYWISTLLNFHCSMEFLHWISGISHWMFECPMSNVERPANFTQIYIIHIGDNSSVYIICCYNYTDIQNSSISELSQFFFRRSIRLQHQQLHNLWIEARGSATLWYRQHI